MYRRMEEDMDINCGEILDGSAGARRDGRADFPDDARDRVSARRPRANCSATARTKFALARQRLALTSNGFGRIVMPIIRVELLEGRTVEQKREIRRGGDARGARILRCTPEAINLVFAPVAREDWAVAGKLTTIRNSYF